MCEKFLLFATLIFLSHPTYAGAYKCKEANGGISFSDHPCANDDGLIIGTEQRQQIPVAAKETENPENDSYTKDLPSMPSPDAATLACFNHVNTTAHFPDPSTTRLLSSSKKWVAVNSVGARQMLTIEVTSKNRGGMYVGTESFNCLMMGDHTTVNTGEYELL